MKLNWKQWINRLAYWSVVDQKTNCYVIVNRDSKDRNFTHTDIEYASPLGQIYHNMSFWDFKLARSLVLYANEMEQESRYLIEYFTK